MSAMVIPSDNEIRRMLQETKTIAVVGASMNPMRPSNFVSLYMQRHGYRILPVNPGCAGKTILGEEVYPDLKSLPFVPDMAAIFRRSEFAGAMADEACRLGIKRIWMQIGVRDDAAAERVKAGGGEVVMDRCPKIEYGRLSGEIGWAGVNSRILSSQKPVLRGGFQHRGLGPAQ